MHTLHLHIHAHLHTYTQVFTHICTRACTHTNTQVHLHAHTDTKMWVTPDQLFRLEHLLFICKSLVYIVSNDLFQCCMQLECFFFFMDRGKTIQSCVCAWIDWRRNGVLRPRETTFHSSLKHSCIPSDFFASV